MVTHDLWISNLTGAISEYIKRITMKQKTGKLIANMNSSHSFQNDGDAGLQSDVEQREKNADESGNHDEAEDQITTNDGVVVIALSENDGGEG